MDFKNPTSGEFLRVILYRLIDFTRPHAVEFSYSEIKDDLLSADSNYLVADILESYDMTFLLGHK